MGERDTYHHGDLRRTLIRETTALVDAHGARGFSLRAAARAAGVDPAAVYRHFANKDALLTAVASEGFAALARRMEEEMARHDTAEGRFLATGEAYVRFAVAHPERFRLMFGPHGPSHHQDDLRGVGPSGEDPYELLQRTLRDMEAEGARPADQTTMPAWSTVHGFATLLVDRNVGGDRFDEVLHTVLHHTLRGMR